MKILKMVLRKWLLSAAFWVLPATLGGSAAFASAPAPSFQEVCAPGSGLASVSGSLWNFLTNTDGICNIGNIRFTFPDPFNTEGTYGMLLEANANISFSISPPGDNNWLSAVSLSITGPNGVLFPGTSVSYRAATNGLNPHFPDGQGFPADISGWSVQIPNGNGIVVSHTSPLPALPCEGGNVAEGGGEPSTCFMPPGVNDMLMQQLLPSGLGFNDLLTALSEPGFETTFLTQLISTPGSTPENPLLPPEVTPGSPWIFPPVTVTDPNQFWWFDPEVAIGYIYNTDPMGPLFDQYIAPDLPFNDTYEMYSTGGGACSTNPRDFATKLGIATQNVPFDFTADLACFAIKGISPLNGLDPDDPTVFLAGIKFNKIGTASITQTPVSAPVPGPLPLLGVGMAYSWARTLRRRSSSISSQRLH